MENIYFDFLPLELNVILSNYLTSEDLNNLCELFPDCQDEQFWIQLFNYKFGKLPDYLPKDIDYQKFYMGIINYLEHETNIEIIVSKHKKSDDEWQRKHGGNFTEYLRYLQKNSLNIPKFDYNKLENYTILFLLNRKLLSKYNINTIMNKYINDIDILTSIVNNYEITHEIKHKFTEMFNHLNRMYLDEDEYEKWEHILDKVREK